jgi:NAD(P)-dependent dehydrogenase (short-subunit alcohol dehydrogenase family)
MSDWAVSAAMFDGPTLADDVAIVTGAGQNIGEAVAETFASEGARVVVADIAVDRAESTVEAIRDAGNDAVAAEADISDEADVAAMVETAEAEFGPVDVMVNCAAISERATMFELEMDEFDAVMDVNLKGTFLTTREAAKSMRDSGGGRIVNFASTSAHVARPLGTAYGMAKRGILSFTESAAYVLAEHDIRVNAISPTRTGTSVGGNDEREREPDPDILRGRWGEPEDQAYAALFLVSEYSDFVTGEELVVDGGALAQPYHR